MLTRRTFLSRSPLRVAACCPRRPRVAQDKSIVVASTTSTQDSGLFGHILPLFKAKTGIDVKVVAQGTGQALDTGRRGDADVVFVHAKAPEEKFVADGFGVKRYPVMYNDFVLIGPKSDPAGIKGTKDIAAALDTIKAKGATFISRGDRSGTHVAELASGRSPASTSPGSRQGAPGTGRSARAWARRSTPRRRRMPMCSPTAAPGSRSRTAAISTSLVEGDKRLFNQYGVILVNPEKHPHVKKDAGPGLHRLADLAGRPEGDRRLQDQRRAAVLPQRQRAGSVMVGSLRSLAGGRHDGTRIRRRTGPAPRRRQPASRADGRRKRIRSRKRRKVQAKFGASGLLKDEIAAGATRRSVRVRQHGAPAGAGGAGKSGPVVLFARNRLCALVRPGLDVTPATLLDRMLDPHVKLGTSTPKADPSGRLRLGGLSQGRGAQARRRGGAGEERRCNSPAVRRARRRRRDARPMAGTSPKAAPISS